MSSVADIIQNADEAYAKKEFESSFELYKEALDQLVKDTGQYQKDKSWPMVYKGMIKSLAGSGDWFRAMQYSGTLITEALNSGNKKLELEARLMACDMHITRGNWAEAENRYKDALKIAETRRSELSIAECNYGLAYLDWRKGNMRGAQFNNSKAMRFLEGNELTPLHLKSLILRATIENSMGNDNEAIKHFKDVIGKLKTLEPGEQLARAHNNLGEVYKNIDDLKGASHHYLECVNVSKKIGSKRGEIYGSANLAETYAFMNKTKEATEVLESMMSMVEGSGDKYIQAQIHYVKGIIALMSMELETACEEFEENIESLRRLGGSAYDMGASYFRWGLALKRLGNNEKAAVKFDHAKRNFLESDSRKYLIILKRYI